MDCPGLELLYALVSPDISQPQDPLVCFIHWELISQGLRCLGKGEQAEPNEKKSELLPNGWASNKGLYTLRYGNDKTKFQLKAVAVEGTLIVNMMDVQKNKVTNLTLNIGTFVDSDKLKDYPKVFKKKRKELKRQLQSELLSPLLGPKVGSGKHETERATTPDYVTPSAPTAGPAPHHTPWVNPPGNIPYGSADLDPTGGMAGSMFFDPFGPGSRPRVDPTVGLPPGSVPPGARFDPFGPPGARFPGPDPDHLPPPGSDDMYM